MAVRILRGIGGTDGTRSRDLLRDRRDHSNFTGSEVFLPLLLTPRDGAQERCWVRSQPPQLLYHADSVELGFGSCAISTAIRPDWHDPLTWHTRVGHNLRATNHVWTGDSIHTRIISAVTDSV